MEEEIKRGDIEEYNNQRKEYILKSGHYCSLEIIVANDDKEQPYVSMSQHGCSPKDVAKMITVLNATLNSMNKEFPMESMLSKLLYGYEYCGTETIDLTKKKGEEDA